MEELPNHRGTNKADGLDGTFALQKCQSLKIFAAVGLMNDDQAVRTYRFEFGLLEGGQKACLI